MAGWKGYSFEDFFCLRKTGVHSIIACAKLYKKSLFINKRYPVGKINEDLFITPKVLYECSLIAVTDATLYYYFQSDDSIMRRPWNIRRLDEIEASEELIRFLHKNKAYKAERYAIQRYFWVLDRQKEEIASLPQKNEKMRRHLNWKYKKALVRFRSIFPFKEFKYIYDIAFPRLMWCYWVCVGIIGKIKQMVKRNA